MEKSNFEICEKVMDSKGPNEKFVKITHCKDGLQFEFICAVKFSIQYTQLLF